MFTIEFNYMAEEKKALAAIGYIPPLFWIPLFLSGGDELARYHGRQSMVVFILGVATFLVFALLRFLFSWFDPLEYLFIIVEGILFAVYIVVSIIAAIRAANGEYWRIPVLGAYSDKLKI